MSPKTTKTTPKAERGYYMMTFREFLQEMNIDSSTPGAEGIVYAAIAACKPDITYREASLIFADLTIIRAKFEELWYCFEDTLDRQNYHRDQNDPVPVSVIIDEVIADLRKRCLIGTGSN